MSAPKYSVLLMRDDSHVKRYRISPVFIKGFIWAIVFLAFTAGAGGYLGYHFYTESEQYKGEVKEMRKTLIHQQVRLERLENVQSILESNDPDELQSLLSSFSIEPAQETAPPPQINLSRIFEQKNLRQAGVENLQARFVGNAMRVRFDLNNMLTDQALSGQVDFKLITNTGDELDVRTNKSDLSFAIQRFKRVQTTFAIPSQTSKDNLFALRLVISAPDGSVIYSEAHPLYAILS